MTKVTNYLLSTFGHYGFFFLFIKAPLTLFVLFVITLWPENYILMVYFILIIKKKKKKMWYMYVCKFKVIKSGHLIVGKGILTSTHLCITSEKQSQIFNALQRKGQICFKPFKERWIFFNPLQKRSSLFDTLRKKGQIFNGVLTCVN